MEQINLRTFIEENGNKLFNNLLKKHDGVLYFDIVLDSLTDEDKMKLYQYIKYHYYYYFHIIERDIIEIYQRHGIKLPQVFIEYPTIKECTLKGTKKLNSLLEEFRLAYSDTDEATVNYFISEFRKKARYDSKRTCCDIVRLINLKKEHPNFKLIVDNITSYDPDIGFGKAISDEDNETIVVTRYEEGDFTHELSHTLFHFYDHYYSDILWFNDICEFVRYCEIEKVSEYLSEFKQRYKSMEECFKELYYRETEKRFGSLFNYYEHLKKDILDSKTDVIVIEDNDKLISIPVTPDAIEKCIEAIVDDEGNNYIDVCLRNYYMEERSLVTFVNAVFLGAIYEGKLSYFHPACHDHQYLRSGQNMVFNECLAAYETIKYSPMANALIPRLKELVGGVLIEILEDYITSKCLKEPEGFVKEKVGKDN